MRVPPEYFPAEEPGNAYQREWRNFALTVLVAATLALPTGWFTNWELGAAIFVGVLNARPQVHGTDRDPL